MSWRQRRLDRVVEDASRVIVLSWELSRLTGGGFGAATLVAARVHPLLRKPLLVTAAEGRSLAGIDAICDSSLTSRIWMLRCAWRDLINAVLGIPSLDTVLQTMVDDALATPLPEDIQ